jgi:glycosyltransferase involved in cell wall biosynthesis
MIIIILPVRNEEETILNTVKDLRSWANKNLINSKILFVNDESTDNTLYQLNKLKTNVVSINHSIGKGWALLCGYICARNIFKPEDDDLIVFLDGDGQIEHRDITSFLRLMDTYCADVVIGNKRHPYSITNYSTLRTFVSRTYNLIVRFLFGFDFRDTQAGLKVFRKYALEKAINKIKCKKFAFDLELIVALRYNGFRIIDAPIKVKPQKNKGSVRLSSIISTFVDTVSIWKKHQQGFYA